MLELTAYQIFLLLVLVAWPFAILGMLLLMGKLENYVKRMDVSTPEEAGLEPVAGERQEREVRVVLGDRVVGEPEQ